MAIGFYWIDDMAVQIQLAIKRYIFIRAMWNSQKMAKEKYILYTTSADLIESWWNVRFLFSKNTLVRIHWRLFDTSKRFHIEMVIFVCAKNSNSLIRSINMYMRCIALRFIENRLKLYTHTHTWTRKKWGKCIRF